MTPREEIEALEKRLEEAEAEVRSAKHEIRQWEARHFDDPEDS